MKRFTSILAVMAMSACSALAVTNDLSVGSGAFPRGPGPKWITLPTMSLVTTPATAADIYKVMTIPAGSIVHAVKYEASTAAGAACTINVGDVANSSSNFVYQGSINTTTPALDNTALIPSVYYASEDALRVTVNDSNSAAVLILKVLVSMLP